RALVFAQLEQAAPLGVLEHLGERPIAVEALGEVRAAALEHLLDHRAPEVRVAILEESLDDVEQVIEPLLAAGLVVFGRLRAASVGRGRRLGLRRGRRSRARGGPLLLHSGLRALLLLRLRAGGAAAPDEVVVVDE